MIIAGLVLLVKQLERPTRDNCRLLLSGFQTSKLEKKGEHSDKFNLTSPLAACGLTTYLEVIYSRSARSQVSMDIKDLTLTRAAEEEILPQQRECGVPTPEVQSRSAR